MKIKEAQLTGRAEDDVEDEEEESSRKRCTTPLISSILGFPEEKWKACVEPEMEDDDVEKETLGSLETSDDFGARNPSSEVAGTSSAVVEVVSIPAAELSSRG